MVMEDGGATYYDDGSSEHILGGA